MVTPFDGTADRAQGISCERTFGAMSDRAQLEAKLADIAAHLAADMAAENLRGHTLTLKLKTTAFEVLACADVQTSIP